MSPCARACVLFAVLLVLPMAASAATYQEHWRVTGGGSSENFGASVARVPDLDGDGIDDVVAGAPGAGYALVLSGADGSTIHTLKGNGGDDFGSSVAATGDLNGDGVADLIVGAPNSDYAVVFSGQDGSQIHWVKGLNGGENYGTAVAGVGDVDGDGLGDFAIGAPFGSDQSGNQTGYVVVYSGKGAGTIHTLYGIKNDEFGCAVAGGVDVDGDGYDDVAVGSRYGPDPKGNPRGSVTIFSGLKGGTIATFNGDTDKSWFGATVALAGDVNADGAPDLLIGAPNEPTSNGSVGMVRVISGADASVLHTMYAGTSEDSLGQSVCALGDLDGDGADDFAAGGPDILDGSSNRTGAVRGWSGAKGDELFTLYGGKEGDKFGIAVAGVGDATGDGKPDFAVGASGNGEAGDQAGCVYLMTEGGLTGTVSIGSGEPYTSTRDVTLYLDWSSSGADVKEVRIRNVDEDWLDWVGVEREISWVLSAGDGEKAVEVEFRDGDGNTCSASSDPVILDTTPPSGGLSLDGGAAFTNQATVAVTLTFTDGGSGLSEARLRNPGEAWGEWFDPSSPPRWTLVTGEGSRTVEAQCSDLAGNVSAVVSDSILVDRTVPAGTISIEGGATYAMARNVTLTLSASDSGGSGLASMRLKRSDVTTWGSWTTYATSATFLLPAGDGMKGVDAQFMDGAGNISATAADLILLDMTTPSVISLTAGAGSPYVLPEEPVVVQLFAEDGTGGSGLASFRTTFDGGATYGEWIPYTSGPVSTEHPGLSGSTPLKVVIRDNAGNESGLSPAAVLFFVEASPPHLLPGGSLAGNMSSGDDIDALTVDLVKGDIAGLKVKAAAGVKGAAFPLVFDLCRPDGERLLTAVPTIAGFVVPETGRYFLVIREQGATGGPGSYTVQVAVKQAKANASVKATVTTGEVSFEAAEGASLKLSLKGAGLDPASVRVIGPDGAMAAAAAGKPGSAKLAAVLDQGTGTYRVTFTATGPVAASLSVKLPKGAVVIEP